MNYCRTSSGDVLRSTSVLQGKPEKREFGTCLHTHTVLLFYVLPLCKPQSHRAIMPRWRYTNIQLWHCWHDDDNDDDDEASALSQDCLNLRPQTLERTQLHLCFEFATSLKKNRRLRTFSRCGLDSSFVVDFLFFYPRFELLYRETKSVLTAGPEVLLTWGARGV